MIGKIKFKTMNKDEEDMLVPRYDKHELKRGFKWVIGIGILVIIASSLLGWFGEAASVAKEEFGPRAALKKYEWFIDAASQLQKKDADINIYSEQLNILVSTYGDTPRNEWSRIDLQTYGQQSAEVSAIRSSYNQLAAEYNAQSAKFNWEIFKTRPDLPPTEFNKLTINR